jgi:mono/diheme cytochrome c family protein
MHRGSIRSRFGPVGSAVLLASALLFTAGPARAADAERGELLYDNHCKVCHTSVVHIREDRKARSREEIRTWVQRWSKELGLQWGSVEVDDVIEYLNKRYYKLESNS